MAPFQPICIRHCTYTLIRWKLGWIRHKISKQTYSSNSATEHFTLSRKSNTADLTHLDDSLSYIYYTECASRIRACVTKGTHSLQVSVQRPRQVLRPERERELDVGGPAQQQHDLPVHGKT